MRRVARLWFTTALVATGILVPGIRPAGAATFGPVDPTLADGAPGSLRDIVQNQATNPGALNCIPNGTTCGDVVLLEAGQTYTLTCAGGGALVHGATPLRLLTPNAGERATIVQTCPATPIIQQGGGIGTIFAPENVILTGGTALMTPACFSDGVGLTPTTQRSWSTTYAEVHTRRDLPERDEFVTRVLGVVADGSREVVFDEMTPNPASSSEAQALFAEAAAAVAAAGGASVAGPELVESSDDSQTEFVGSVGDQTQPSTTFTNGIGPTLILVGHDQSETLFVPLGCTNFNDNTHTERFVDDNFQTTVTHRETYEVAGLVVRFAG